MADTKFPFLNLPVELRRLVYRHLTLEDIVWVEVVSNYMIGNKPDSIRFYTIQDLNILQASRQIHEESSAVFYNERQVVIYLYTCIPPYGCHGLFGNRTFRVDLKRIRMLHLLTPPGFFPRELLDGVEEKRIRRHSQALANALGGNGGHHMQYLLMESYHFVTAVLDDDLAFGLRLENMVEPLREIKGIRLVYIRSMKIKLLSYLRALEKEMMSWCDTSPQHSAATPRDPPQSAYKEIEDRCKENDEDGEQDDFADPDYPIPNRIYRELDKQPLYPSTDFLRRCRDFTPDEEE